MAKSKASKGSKATGPRRGKKKTRSVKKKAKRLVRTSKVTAAGKGRTRKKTKTTKAVKAAKSTKKVGKTATAKSSPKPAVKSRSTMQANSRTSKVAKKSVAVAGSVGTNRRKAKRANPPATSRAVGLRRAVEPPEPISEPLVFRLGSEVIELADEDRPLPKSRMGKKALRQFTEMLLAKRKELVGDVKNLTKGALSGHHSPSDGSYMPLHMADIGSDNWEQEFTLDLLANERGMVREIDEALQRIEDGTYGICLATHRSIGQARLSAKPWAKYCIEYASAREQGLVP